MSDCPECGMRDDDWFLCRREPCAINKTKRDGDRIADLERQIAELRAELSEAKDMANALNGDVTDFGQRLEAAEAENARLRALPLKEEVERVLEQAKVVLQGEAAGRTWYEQTAEALEDVDALLSRLRAGVQEGWRLVPGDPDLAEHLIRAALVAGYKGVGSTDEEAETLADAKMADPKELAFSKAQYAGMLAAAPSDHGGDRG